MIPYMQATIFITFIIFSKDYPVKKVNLYNMLQYSWFDHSEECSKSGL